MDPNKRISTSNIKKRSTKLEDLRRLLKNTETTLPHKNKHSFSFSVFTDQISQEKHKVEKLVEKIKNNLIYNTDPMVKMKKLNGRQSLFKNYKEEKEKSDEYQLPKHIFNINAIDRITELGGLNIVKMNDIGLKKVKQESYAYKIIPRQVEFKENLKTGIFNKFLNDKEARIRRDLDNTINKYHDSIRNINMKINNRNNNHLQNLNKLISTKNYSNFTNKIVL